MIKALGAIFIIGSVAIIGSCASANLAVRARVLRGFSYALDIMHSEIGERLTPLNDLFVLLEKSSVEPLNVFFDACAKEMNKKPDIPFGLIWTKTLKHAEYLKLRPREIEVISSLGNVLGRYSATEQVQALSHAARCVESMTITADKEKNQLGALYTKLGVICGIAVVIVFI